MRKALFFLLLSALPLGAQIFPGFGARPGQVQADTFKGCSDAGSTDTYACNLTPALTAYTVNACYQFKANTANTGAASINFNGAGPITIVKVAGGITTTLADNDIRVGQIVRVCYDGTNMQMTSQIGNAPITSITFIALPEFVAAKCQNTTASLGLSSFTSNQPTAVCVTGTNSTYGVAQFPDSDGEYSLQDRVWLPSDLTGVIDLDIKWRTSATTGNVVWQVQTACVADAETGDPSWNTASTVTDTAKGTTQQWNDATISTVTITGCAANEIMLFRFFRDRTHASDTLGAMPELISLRFKIRRSI